MILYQKMFLKMKKMFQIQTQTLWILAVLPKHESGRLVRFYDICLWKIVSWIQIYQVSHGEREFVVKLKAKVMLLHSTLLISVAQEWKSSATFSICALVERVADQSEGRGSIPASFDPHVEVSLGKTLNPKIAPNGQAIGVWMCVWVTDEQVGSLKRRKKRYINTVHLPYTETTSLNRPRSGCLGSHPSSITVFTP